MVLKKNCIPCPMYKDHRPSFYCLSQSIRSCVRFSISRLVGARDVMFKNGVFSREFEGCFKIVCVTEWVTLGFKFNISKYYLPYFSFPFFAIFVKVCLKRWCVLFIRNNFRICMQPSEIRIIEGAFGTVIISDSNDDSIPNEIIFIDYLYYTGQDFNRGYHRRSRVCRCL